MKVMTDIPTITFAGLTYRLPFARLFRAHTPTERSALSTDIHEIGVIARIVTYDSTTYGQRCVIDGATRLAVSAALGLAAIPTHHRGALDDIRAQREAISLNTARRHLSVEELEAFRTQRNADIIADRQSGDSLAVIGRRWGLSREAVRQVLEDAKQAGVNQLTPERVTGLDGKNYAAEKPGTRSQESGVRGQGTGNRRQEPGDTSQETGNKRQETEDRGQQIVVGPVSPPPAPEKPVSQTSTTEAEIAAAQRALGRLRSALDQILAGEFASRLRSICGRHRIDPAALVQIEAALADLAAEVAIGTGE